MSIAGIRKRVATLETVTRHAGAADVVPVLVPGDWSEARASAEIDAAIAAAGLKIGPETIVVSIARFGGGLDRAKLANIPPLKTSPGEGMNGAGL